MSDVVRIWLEISHNAAFRCGGWAFVIADGDGRLGAVGGERTASPERIALAGLADVLKTAPATASLQIHSAAKLVVGVPRRLDGSGEPPAEDLELWAPIATALKTRAVRFVPAENRPRSPTAFAVAWSELARDKAKAGGAFRAIIPKPNLAKAGV